MNPNPNQNLSKVSLNVRANYGTFNIYWMIYQTFALLKEPLHKTGNIMVNLRLFVLEYLVTLKTIQSTVKTFTTTDEIILISINMKI